MNKKILFVVIFLMVCFLAVFVWWYKNKDEAPVAVLTPESEQSLTFGWPTEIAKNPTPKATISDFNVDLNPTTTQNIATEIPGTVVTRPSASSFSVTDVIKPPIVVENTCSLPALLDSCCSLSGVNRNECIASIALLRGLASLCDYITGGVAKTACVNAITKPNTTTAIDRTFVYKPNTTTGVVSTKTTNPTGVAVTTYTTDGYGDIDPTVYITDGSSFVSTVGSNSGLLDSLLKTVPKTPTTTIPNTKIATTTYSSNLTADGFNQRESEKAMTLVSVSSLSGPFLAHPGEIVFVVGEGFAKEGNILNLKGEGFLSKDYKTKGAPSLNGRDFSTILPLNIMPGVYSLSVSKENTTTTQSSGTGLTLKMTVL